MSFASGQLLQVGRGTAISCAAVPVVGVLWYEFKSSALLIGLTIFRFCSGKVR